MRYHSWQYLNIVIVITCILFNIFLWTNDKSELEFFWDTPWLFIAQGAGVAAISSMSLTFVYTTRLEFLLKIFGELQHLYVIHKWLSIFAWFSMFLHFIAFMLYSISYPSFFGYYLLFGTNLSFDYGKISFILVTVLVALTISSKIPYHIWKLTHKFMAVAFFFAVVHVFTVSGDMETNLPLRYWTMGTAFIGGVSCIYTLFFYPFFFHKARYIVTEVNFIDQFMFIIQMKSKFEKLKHLPGQFAFFRFNSSRIGKELHPFTIASSPESETLRICVKIMGDYTNRLRYLKVGTLVDIWGPYGQFHRTFIQDSYEQVWFAGGIGVTPFLAMIDHQKKVPQKSKKWFFYCTYSEKDAPFHNEFSKNLKEINISYFHHEMDTMGLITADYIISRVPDFKNKIFLLCGPKPMQVHLKKVLHNVGVKVHDIIHEDFTLR